MTGYYACGKQVLRDGKDVAQACDPGTAIMIAEALNNSETLERHPDLFSDRPTLVSHACRAYQASDQMLCPCGLQWDINDPDPPTCPNS